MDNALPNQLGIQREALEIRLIENNEKLKKLYEGMLEKSIKEMTDSIDMRTKAMKEQEEARRLAERAKGQIQAEKITETF